MLEILCTELDWQLSCLAQICSSSIHLISTFKEFETMEAGRFSRAHWKEDMESAQWVELLRPFTNRIQLFLSREVAPHICHALGELSTDEAIEVLPALARVYVRGNQSLGSL